MTFIRNLLIVAAALCCGAAVCSLPVGRVSADSEIAAEVNGEEFASFSDALSHWTDGTTLILRSNCEGSVTLRGGNFSLDLNGYTLQSVSGRTVEIKEGGSLTLSDRSDGEGKISGGGIYVEGSLEMNGGCVTQNHAETGGGINISSAGSFVMRGGKITQNTSSGDGAGVYVGGNFTIGAGSDILIGGNLKEESENNVYLVGGHTIRVEGGFTGQVGVSLPAPGLFAEGLFAEETPANFTADDLTYTVRSGEEGLSTELSPLSSLSVEFVPTEKIFPTTPLDDLKSYLTVTGTNGNGVPYREAFSYALSTPTGGLEVGENTVTVSAEERVFQTFNVNAEAPTLLSIEANYSPSGKIYFDTPLYELEKDLTVTGSYDDGHSRRICSTAEETSSESGESYISDAYTLSGDFSVRLEGLSTVTVRASGRTARFNVEISKYVYDIRGDAAFRVLPVTVLEGAAHVEPRAFLPYLPEEWSVEPAACVGELPIGSVSLTPGVYTVTISFTVTDRENFEDITDTLEGILTVNRGVLSGDSVDGEPGFLFTSESGFPPDWSFSVTDITGESSLPALEGDYEAKQIFDLRLRRGGDIVAKSDRVVTVRLLIGEKLRGKNLTLYRLMDDGTTQRINSRVEGHYLVLETDDVAQARYVVAVDGGFSVYLVLTICFGCACVAGAGLLLWYFVKRRHLKIR